MKFCGDDNWDIFVTWLQTYFSKSIHGFGRLSMRMCLSHSSEAALHRRIQCCYLWVGLLFCSFNELESGHDDVIKWKHFPGYWPFVRGIHRSPVKSPHKGQWRGALMFTLICARINSWVNNREAGDLRRYPGHYDVTVMGTNYGNPYVWLTFGHILLNFCHYLGSDMSSSYHAFSVKLLIRLTSNLGDLIVEHR